MRFPAPNRLRSIAMGLPPGPAAPAAWQSAAWVARPGPYMERCRREYGDFFSIKLASVGTFVFVSDPAAIKQVFKADRDVLRAGEGNTSLEPVLGKRSLLLLDGADHLRHRRLMLPPFHGERLRGYGELMRSIADREIDTWPAGTAFATQGRMQAITLEIILRVVFGIHADDRRERMSRLLVRLLQVATRPVGMVPIWREMRGRFSPVRPFYEALDAVDAALYEEIAERRVAPDLEERDDMLSLLCLARDEDGEPMTDVELRDELLTLLTAGHETTATTLAWACERLVRTPGALDRIASGDVAYADAAVNETLRLRQPIPVVARRCSVDYELGGWALPAGTVIAPCIYLVHRRADIYPDPYTFRPERFLEKPPETYTFLPFGGGTRRCIGASFAQYEMRVVLQAVVERLVLDGRQAGARAGPAAGDRAGARARRAGRRYRSRCEWSTLTSRI